MTADWGCAAKDWKEAMNQFAILYEDRFTKAPAQDVAPTAHRGGRSSQALPAAVDKSTQRLEHKNLDSPVFTS